MPPRLVSVNITDEHGRLSSVALEHVSPVGTHGSKVILEYQGTWGLRLTVQQSPMAPKQYWESGQVELDLMHVRALRDACNQFLDRMHDEAE